MNTCFILLGSNLGDRKTNLNRAVELIGQFVGDILLHSSLYETAAWGKTDQPAFYNQVVKLQTDLKPDDLLLTIQQLEDKMGREPADKWAARLIDMDILYYDSIIFNKAELIIPHPHLQDRRFVLIPLCEIAADYLHPVFKKSNQELLNNCKDKLEVRKL